MQWFGESPAVIVALIGVAISLIFNVINFIFNWTTRDKTASLSHFNSRASKPIDENLREIGRCCDDIEDVKRLPIEQRRDRLSIQSGRFHKSRRELERVLQDVQNSPLIDGTDWVSFKDDECDRASEALNDCMKAQTDEEQFGKIDEFKDCIDSLRQRLIRKLDCYSAKLM